MTKGSTLSAILIAIFAAFVVIIPFWGQGVDTLVELYPMQVAQAPGVLPGGVVRTVIKAPRTKAGVKDFKPHGLIGLRLGEEGKIYRVYFNSPAQKAGILVDDVITSINFRKFKFDEMNGDPGDVTYITIKRTLPKLKIDEYELPEREMELHFQVEYVDTRTIDRVTNPQWFYDREQIIEVAPPT